jgi:hypothetical protein
MSSSFPTKLNSSHRAANRAYSELWFSASQKSSLWQKKAWEKMRESRRNRDGNCERVGWGPILLIFVNLQREWMRSPTLREPASPGY